MIEIDFNEKTYSIKNSITEFSIDEFEFINHKLNDTEMSLIEKWVEILNFLGVDYEVIDVIPVDSFLEIIKTMDFKEDITEIIKDIKLDGVTYSCYKGETFRLTIKEVGEYQRVIGNNPLFYISKLLSVVYKNDTIFETKESLKIKEEFFKQQSMTLAIPILKYLNDILIKKMGLEYGV